VIAVAFVAAVILRSLEFPTFHLPFSGTWIGLLAVSGVFFWTVIRAYRTLWKRPTFWLVLIGFLPAHFSLWWFFILRLAQGQNLLRQSTFYAVGGGMEVFVFCLIMFWLYKRHPDVSSYAGHKTR